MYDFKVIENKWQEKWNKANCFHAINGSDKEKYYILVEFPYPSGSGLHVGHVRSYTALDSMARMKRMQGFNVLFPMGWDAFGAPAEQYAIKNKVYPSSMVETCINTFKGQMIKLGFSFDWEREFSTTDPTYYKWTQWQFLQFFKAGLAYKAEKEINWCPNCLTGLSNEDSEGGVCERCGTATTKKLKEQWMLRMSNYSQRLLDGLDETEFMDKIKTAQINWIGKSEGAEVDFKIKDTKDVLKVFTTRPDTLFGVTFMVVSPEHSYLEKYKDKIKNYNEVEEYKKYASSKSEIERTDLTKEKTGVKLEGLYAINPVNNETIEIWISDYVLSNYGTGAIMAVPAHDDRDFAFATKFGINIKPVIAKQTGTSRENESYKESIVAVVYDKKKDKYLTLNWKEKGGYLFVGGTKKENESSIECAIREIKEETGYNDITFISESFPINHHYYAYNKNKAYEIMATGLLFELNSYEKKDQSLDEDEKNNFNIMWKSKEEILSLVNDELHSSVFTDLLNPSAFVFEGTMINSGILNGIKNKEESINKIIKFLEDEGSGKKTINYRLQDWIFSRQRFWGEPIPMVHCDKCGWVPLDEKDLPLILPDVPSYEPTENGESPLSNVKDWVNTTCPKCGCKAVRETDTMPNWAGSSWYWLRYTDPHNDKTFADMEALKYWGMVDYYNGGMEHATRHLLYARFWHQFLYDQKLVPTKEPFKKRVAHGMILGENGEKMSKSKNNVVNPDDMVKEYGADALRTYEMFIGDYSKDASWSENGLKGCKRFLDKVYRLKEKVNNSNLYTDVLEVKINKTIKKVIEDINTMNYNTAVSALMILVNNYDEMENISKKDYRTLLHLLNPIAPHITEELNDIMNLGEPFYESDFPNYDKSKIVESTVSIACSVNGKLRATFDTPIDTFEEELIKLSKLQENVIKHIEGKEIVKEIVIINKIVNIVVK